MAALSEIEKDCFERGIELNFSVVPEPYAPIIMARYPHLDMDNSVSWQDYLYTPAAMATFSGRRYSGHRNHIKKFLLAHPNAFFRPLSRDDVPLLQKFWSEFEVKLNGLDLSGQRELQYAKEFFDCADYQYFCTGAVEENGRLLAVALGEICGNTLIIHIEKGMHDCNGIYPFMVQSFAHAYQTPALQYINREDDASEPGLRYSKFQYAPTARGVKYRFRIRRKLPIWNDIPELKEQELVCTKHEPAYTEEKYKDMLSKFPRGAVSFSVSVHASVCGEVILYGFDYRGRAWLRFIPDSCACDAAQEKAALSLISRWALYGLELSVIYFPGSQDPDILKRLPDHSVAVRSGNDVPAFYEKRI